MAYQYAVTTLVSVHTHLRGNILDTGSSNATLAIMDASDTLLASITLTKPSGTVNATTGQLTLTQDSPETNAPAAGTADHAELRGGDGNVVCTIPVVEGSAAQSGAVVISNKNIIVGARVDLISATIG